MERIQRAKSQSTTDTGCVKEAVPGLFSMRQREREDRDEGWGWSFGNFTQGGGRETRRLPQQSNPAVGFHLGGTAQMGIPNFTHGSDTSRFKYTLPDNTY